MDHFGAHVGQESGATFTIEFPAFSPKRAATSWLRSAYLAFFAALGYRFIFRPELDIVRAKIKNPEQDEPSRFRLISDESNEPTLMRIEAPEALRSYVMLYDRNTVFLPRYNDHGFYERLAAYSPTLERTSFQGTQYPWPSHGPTFFHDLALAKGR